MGLKVGYNPPSPHSRVICSFYNRFKSKDFNQFFIFNRFVWFMICGFFFMKLQKNSWKTVWIKSNLLNNIKVVKANDLQTTLFLYDPLSLNFTMHPRQNGFRPPTQKMSFSIAGRVETKIEHAILCVCVWVSSDQLNCSKFLHGWRDRLIGRKNLSS